MQDILVEVLDTEKQVIQLKSVEIYSLFVKDGESDLWPIMLVLRTVRCRTTNTGSEADPRFSYN